MQKLVEAVQKKGPVCVGLDTQMSFLPDYLKKKTATDGEKIFEFNRAIIDATEDEAGCYQTPDRLLRGAGTRRHASLLQDAEIRAQPR